MTAYDYRNIESEMPAYVTIVINVPCEYVVGDVNGNGVYNGMDINYGVFYFQGYGPPPVYECECTESDTWYVSGDVNGSCSYNGVDITYGVAYLKGGPAPFPCFECIPGGYGVLSDNKQSYPIENITTVMNSEIRIEARLSESNPKQMIAEIYLIADDSVAFINIPLEWESDDIEVKKFRPSGAISGWEVNDALFRENNLLLSAWNDLRNGNSGNKDPIVSNGDSVFLGQITFSARDTSDFNGFVLFQFTDLRIGPMMLGHPNGITYSEPTYSFSFEGRDYNPKTGIEKLPSELSIAQNYPNPFNAQTVFKYELSEDSHVSIEIYDVLGRNIETLLDEYQPSGYHQITWNAKNQVTGTYFYMIRAGEITRRGKLTLLR